MAQEWIGFQVDREIRAVLTRSVEGRTKPQVIASFRLAQDSLSSQNLAFVATQVRGKETPWALVLNRGDYQFSRVDRPDVPDAELEQSLRWLVPFKEVSPQDATISWVPVPEGAPGKTPQLYVAACSQAMVGLMANRFRSAKLELGAVDVREMAQRNIAARISKDKLVCLLVAEPTGIQVTVTLGSDLYLDRFIRESVLESGSMDEACIKRIGIEIRRSLEFVRNAYPAAPAVEIYLGPTPIDFELAAKLAEELGQPVSKLNLGSIFDWPAASPLADPKTQAEFFLVLGACLRL